jgi:hypothetical protein
VRGIPIFPRVHREGSRNHTIDLLPVEGNAPAPSRAPPGGT